MDIINFQFSSAVALVYGLLKWLLMGLLVTSSRIWNRTLLAVALAASVALTGIGMLFKVEHWAAGSELMLAGATAMASCYVVWYRRKTPHRLLDYLKLAWVLFACATLMASAAIHAFIAPLGAVTESLFWAMALLFGYQRWILRPKQFPS